MPGDETGAPDVAMVNELVASRFFGDTDAVHVELQPGGGYSIEHIVRGDSVEDVLEYVQYRKRPLIEKLRSVIDSARASGQISEDEGTRLLKRYKQGLKGYTYLAND